MPGGPPPWGAVDFVPANNPGLAAAPFVRQNKVFELGLGFSDVGSMVVAKKSKDARSYVKMQSSESSHCYYLQKNRNNTKDRMQLRKYDPIVRKHVMYKEGKM